MISKTIHYILEAANIQEESSKIFNVINLSVGGSRILNL